MSMLQTKGELVYPTYSIQGIQVDLTSTSNSIPINSTGARIESTELCFVNWSQGTGPVIKPAADTIASCWETSFKSGEFIPAGLSTTKGNNYGSKHFRFLPAIQKLSV